ncbi:AMP-binding protein [Streptomyces muensis]|uniref:AMP-binding protein n=1 Tax=Streptomyces muensis TaxID=1077944 RepID=A0A9X1PWF0_STRM4|nr:AMP-binding protein [Streptomyces muensis]MCF1592566.1 AMP-binding protein [Streptomyces muensis]
MTDTGLTLPQLVMDSASNYGDHDAFVFPDTRQTYRELEASCLAVAASLRALGVRPGDAVGLLMPNCMHFVHAMIGATMAGAMLVPVNSRLSPRELAYVIPDAGMKVLLLTDVADEHVDYAARVYEAFPDLREAEAGKRLVLRAAPDLEHAVVLGTRRATGFMTGAEFLRLGSDQDLTEVRARAEAVAPDDPYIMMYTSGTTSMPKGCPLSHSSVIGLGAAVGAEGFHITEDDRMWNPLPLFHVSSQAPLAGVLRAGAAYVSMSHFSPAEAIEQIVRERATLMYPAYPTLLGPMLEHPSRTPETFSGVRAVLCVGPPDLLRDYQKRLGDDTAVVSCYGSTELGGSPVMGRLDDPLEARVTSGRPFVGIEVQIRDRMTGDVLPAGETGAVWMRGFNVFGGYHNDPAKTAESFDAEGFFTTGDLASLDADGNLTFRGRTKDMLKVGGENVGALEVEAYLTSHPAVLMAAVVGVPDPKYDEVPAAFVQLVPGAAVGVEELLDFCRSGLAKFKVPRYVRLVETWPMSATKIQKFRLRERLVAELAADDPTVRPGAERVEDASGLADAVG